MCRVQTSHPMIDWARRVAPAWYAASVRVCALSFSVSFSSDV